MKTPTVSQGRTKRNGLDRTGHWYGLLAVFVFKKELHNSRSRDCGNGGKPV